MDLTVNELETVKQKIAATEVKLVKAEEEGDIPRRNRLEEYILELQKKENRLSQSAGKIICKTPIDGCSFNICCYLSI